VEFGEQTPVQEAVVPVCVHTSVQGVVVPQLPWASQSCTPPLLHCDWLGAHVPAQPRPVTQVWLVHAVAPPQVPVSLQIWELLPTHWIEWGMQAAQVPGSRQTAVGAAQVVCVVQLPVLSHDWMALPRQRVWPGPQAPPQLPPRQVWFMGQGKFGRRHSTHVLVAGLQTPASPHSTPVQGPASTAPSEPPSEPPPPPVLEVLLVVPPVPVIIMLVVVLVDPPELKPPYWGKPHDAKTPIKVTTNAADTKRKERTIVEG
jgi:hypothetical protein